MLHSPILSLYKALYCIVLYTQNIHQYTYYSIFLSLYILNKYYYQAAILEETISIVIMASAEDDTLSNLLASDDCSDRVSRIIFDSYCTCAVLFISV